MNGERERLAAKLRLLSELAEQFPGDITSRNIEELREELKRQLQLPVPPA